MTWSTALRWMRFALAAGAVLAWFLLARRALLTGDGPAALGPLLAAFSLLIVAAVLLYRELSTLAAGPITRWIDQVYLPGGRARRPPLDYRLPRYYERSGRLEEAAACYRDLCRDYPRDLTAAAGLVRVLRQLDDSGDELAAVYRKAGRRFGAGALAEAAARPVEDLEDGPSRLPFPGVPGPKRTRVDEGDRVPGTKSP